MGRPVTLFTGQWADLSLEELCKKAAEFGYHSAIEKEQGLQQSLAALRYGRAIERECVRLGDLRGTTMDEQRGDIVLAVKDFEEALADWDASSGGPFGALAVTFGLANGPPPWSE